MITKGKSSKLISKILTPALKLWLRSQVEAVENLQIQILGSDRQILRGYIPQVQLGTDFAIYQGLHLGKIELVAENIRVNLGQVVRGKPLQLLEAIRAHLEVELTEAQLQASLASPLLSTALTDILLTLVQDQPSFSLSPEQIQWQTATIYPEKIQLAGLLTPTQGSRRSLILQTGLEQPDGHQLCLTPLQISGLGEENGLNLPGFPIDLGPDVDLETLSLTQGKIRLQGALKVQP